MVVLKRKVPYISQMEHSECGLACLTMVLNYYKHFINLSELREQVGSSANGYSFYDLLLIAKDKNMDCKAYRVEKKDLKNLRLPLILHWKDNHYVILEKISKNKYFIIDPALGRKKFNGEEFGKLYSGNSMSLIPTRNFVERKKDKSNLLLDYAKSQKKFITFIVLVTFLMQLLAITIPLITQQFTDNILVNSKGNLINLVGIGVFSIFVSYMITSIIRGYLIAKLQSRLDSLIMSKFMNTLLRLPYLFFNSRSSGDLLFRANSNNLINQLLSTTAISLIIDLLLVFSYMIIMFYYSVKLSLTLIAISLLIVVTLVLNTAIIKKLSDQNVSNQSDVQIVLADSIKGITDVKMLGLEEKMFENWYQKFKEQIFTTERLNMWNSLIQSFTSAIQMIIPLLILWIGSFHLIQGEVTLGVLIAFSTISVSFIRPLVSLSNSYSQILSTSSYFQRIFDVIETTPEINNSNVANIKIEGNIKFENVCYRYSKYAKDIISDVSFTIKKGETIAIVGASGSGKSTLAKLLLGFYLPTQGNIYYENISLEDLNKTQLRKQIGSVIQESNLFNRSVYENISMFQPDVTIEDVMEASKKANIYEEIMNLPLKFGTTISENGSNFSGGQIQRILIARALVRNPSMLVFDEASSALDNISEKIIHDNLSKLSSTKIIIAHRLSTIRNADRIIVMDKGTIVECGNHHTLLQKEGYYHQLYTSKKNEPTFS